MPRVAVVCSDPACRDEADAIAASLGTSVVAARQQGLNLEVTEATVGDLMKPLHEYEIVFGPADESIPESIKVLRPQRDGDSWRLVVRDVARHAEALATLSQSGLEVRQTSSRTRSLEQHFIDLVSGDSEGS